MDTNHKLFILTSAILGLRLTMKRLTLFNPCATSSYRSTRALVDLMIINVEG